jgi:hypothetical protein
MDASGAGFAASPLDKLAPHTRNSARTTEAAQRGQPTSAGGAANPRRETKTIAAPPSSCVRRGPNNFTVLHATITGRRRIQLSTPPCCLLSPLVAIRFPSYNSENNKESANDV